MTDKRLPPGQVRTHKWPVLDLGDQPVIDQRDWSLSAGGMVRRPIKWSWNDFMAQPHVSSISDIHCVTQWSRFDNRWEGVSAQTLLEAVQPDPDALHLMLRSYDCYSTNLPLADFDDDDVLLAHSWEGEPLTREHGGPVRVIVPKLYLWKSAKWLRHITFTNQDIPGTWEARGYHMRGDPWKEERYDD